MNKIALTALNKTETRILEYLNQNASAVLVEKINAGKKTLSGAVQYATGEAKKLAAGAGSVCVDDETVFGWIIHFFEEDNLHEPKQKPAKIRTPGEKSQTPKQPARAEKQNAEQPKQETMFMELFK